MLAARSHSFLRVPDVPLGIVEAFGMVPPQTPMPDREWSTCFRSKPLTELRLAQLLRGFGVRPQQWGEGPKAFRRNARGYYRADFQPIFDRYVRQTPDVPAVAGTLRK